MRGTIFTILALALLFGSCNKESLISPPGSWTYGVSTYGAISAVGSATTNTLIADNQFPPNPDSLIFYFNTYPTTPGSYNIVNSVHPATGQVGMVFSEGQSRQLYVPAGSTMTSATVTLTSGKVSIHVPVIQVALSSNLADTSSFTANINQQ